MFMRFIPFCRRLAAARKGSIAVMGALSLSGVLGMAGLAVEIGNGYAIKVRNQRIADLAALGGALAYKNGGQSTTVATQVARDIVVANGLPATSAQVEQVAVGSNSGIRVTLTTTVPIRLARMIANNAPSYDVTNSATASLVSGSSAGCITALSSSSMAISADGGAGISANGCGVNTNGTIYSSNSSAKVTAKSIVAQAINDVAAQWSQNAVTTNPVARNWSLRPNGAMDFVKDGNAAVKDALCQVNKLTGQTDTYNPGNNPNGYTGGNTSCSSPAVTVPSLTSSGSVDWNTDWTPRNQGGFSNYLTGDYTCQYVVPAGTYNIRDLNVGGGCSVTFQSGSTLSFRNVNANGASLSFGNGDITISGTFTVNTDTTVTMGNGRHSFGTLTINGGKSLVLGTGNLVVGNGITVSGGAYLKANISTGNTVTLGKSGAGHSINVDGGSQVCFSSNCLAPTAEAGTFAAKGNINQPGSGGTIVFPNSALHVIEGDMTLTGAAYFGKGLYIIKGNWTNGTGCGGCGMNGIDVTFALGGTFNFGGGTSFDLAAPTSTSSYGIPDVLIVTKSSTATAISAGSNGRAAGMIYAPNSAFSSTGGASISSNGSACMMLLVSTVTVTGSGTVNTANCNSQSGSAGGGTVALIQ